MRYLACLILLFATTAVADDNYGVILPQERVVTVPQDQGKWHISVVTDDSARSKEILGWFDSGKLKKLRDQVQFHPVTTKSVIFAERYKPNTPITPMVRVQDKDGFTIYEAAGNDLPMTADGLYGAIADAAFAEEILPWRRHHANPSPSPTPEPTPPLTTPDTPAVDGGGPPVLESEGRDLWSWVIWMFIIGIAVGTFEAAKSYHSKQSK